MTNYPKAVAKEVSALYYVDDYSGSGAQGSGLVQFSSLRAARAYIRQRRGKLGRIVAYDATEREGLDPVEIRDNGTSDGWVAIYRKR